MVKLKIKRAKDDGEETKRRKHEQIPDHSLITAYDVQMKDHGAMTSNRQTSGVDTTVKKRKKEKRKEDQREKIQTAKLDPDTEDSEPHHKTRKRKSTAALEAEDQPDPDTTKPKLKKRKKSLEAVDPTNDSSLSDQSKKALAYVVSQYANPQDWKFNKARQNWLIRHLWSPEAVPEKYTTLVVRYLSRVQGRVKDTLIESCRKNIDLPAQAGSDSVDDHPTSNEQRARLLLDALNNNL